MRRLVSAALVVMWLVAPAAADDRASRLANAAAQQKLAQRSLDIGEYERGLPYAEGALHEREAVLGPDDPLVADSLLVVGIMHGKNGEQSVAETLLTRALHIREKSLAKGSAGIAAAQLALGTMLLEADDFVRAEPLLVGALASEETRADSPTKADALEVLASLWSEKDDPRCEPMFRRAIAIVEKAAGPDDLAVTRPVKALADMLVRRGDPGRAEPFYRRAMAILESTGDLGDPRRAGALLDFARVQLATGHPAEALRLAGFAFTIDEAILGANHPRIARDLIALARLARGVGDAARAERYTWRAVTIRERVLGSDHPDVAAALVELANSYAARGDNANASKLMNRALAIFRRALGPKHPTVAATLVGVAKLAVARKDIDGALAAMTEAGEIREASLDLLLYAGSERQKRLYLETLTDETDAALSLHAQFAPANPAAARLALLTLLRRKGRVLDTMADALGALRSRVSSQDIAALEKLALSRSRLASLVLRGPLAGKLAAHDAEVRTLEDEAQKAEADISARSPAYRATRVPVTLPAVQSAIPAGRSLVEISTYQPLATGERRYIAYVLERTGDPHWVDLGPAAKIDALVNQVRVAFADAKSDAAPPARELDALVMAPLRTLLGTTHQIFLSPDGQLNLLPFGALVDEKGKFVVETYAITYLTTGRDLLRIAAPPPGANTSALVVAAPAFGPSGTRHDEDEDSSQRHSPDLSNTFFVPLNGTAQEGAALKKLFGAGGLVVMGGKASESEIKKVRAPIVLHIATHGFFLHDPAGSTPTTASEENPLLRSGLALAGANRLESGADDGVLTALEASGLDLYGTQVVALSACETGLGEVHNGEGVYGLRRALVIAGSESQVISLWSVDDDSTRDLMIGYYNRLAAGSGRTESLRTAQLALLADKATSHPFYWAAFIQSGDWRPVRGSLAGAGVTQVAPVARGARGCGGCEASSTPSGIALIVIVLAVALGRRRRAAPLAGLVGLLALAVPAHAAPGATLTLPGSKLVLALPGAANDWTVTDASQGRQTWDNFERKTGPNVSVLLNRTLGPTSCVLTLNLLYLAGFKAARLVPAPGYLPAGMYPAVIEGPSTGSITTMACAEIPEGTMTAIIRYTGAAWQTDAAVVTPLLAAYEVAAAWGPGSIAANADRVVKLPATGLAVKLPPTWRERVVPNIDVVFRARAGKPTLTIGIKSEGSRPPMKVVNGKLVQPAGTKGSADDCQFWDESLHFAADPDLQPTPRPAFAGASWHEQGWVRLGPDTDQLTLCHETRSGHVLVYIQYAGAWNDADVADTGPILKAIAASL